MPRGVDRGACTRTTVASNAILEGKGARTGLITTRGFRDILEIRTLRMPRLYDLALEKPPPLVERELRRRGARAARTARRDPCAARRRLGAIAAAARCWSREACRRSPSRCCMPTPTPRTSVASARSGARQLPGVPVTPQLRGRCPRSGSTSARRRRSSTPICSRWSRRYLDRLARRLRGRGSGAPLLRHAVERRPDVGRAAARVPLRIVESRPGGRA